MSKLLIIFLLCLCVISCKNSVFAPNPFPEDSSVPSDLIITLERTACFGKCPIYDLTIDADGVTVFNGKKFTEVIGKAETKLSREKVAELIGAFKEADFFSLDNSYQNGNWNCSDSVTDMPSAITSIQINGAKKNIRHYQGCEEKTLHSLENKIDEITETKRWVGERK